MTSPRDAARYRALVAGDADRAARAAAEDAARAEAIAAEVLRPYAPGRWSPVRYAERVDGGARVIAHADGGHTVRPRYALVDVAARYQRYESLASAARVEAGGELAPAPSTLADAVRERGATPGRQPPRAGIVDPWAVDETDGGNL